MIMKTIVVLGATGNQGSSVVNEFLHEPGWKVRGVTRDLNSPAAKELADRGVNVVQADVDDPETLPLAFRGANVIFAVTDFWAALFDPSLQKQMRPEQDILQFAYDLEVKRGKNIVDAAARVVGEPLEKFVWSALSDVKGRSKGKYLNVCHFDGKAAVTKYIFEKHPGLAAVTSRVQLGWYVTNALNLPIFAPKKQSDGVYELAHPVDGDTPIPFMIPRQDTGQFVKAAIELPPGQNILAYDKMMSFKEFLRIFGEVNQVKTRYVKNCVEDWARDFPPVGRLAGESLLYTEEPGYDGADPSAIHPSQLKIRLSDVERWMRSTDWSRVL